MNKRPILPPIFPKGNPSRRQMISSPQSYRRSARNPNFSSGSVAPRQNLFLNPDLNEYDDPIEHANEYRKLKQQIFKMKQSLLPYEEELRALESYNDPTDTDVKTEKLKVELTELLKEKESLDSKLASIRRQFNEVVQLNKDAEVNYLKQTFRKKDIDLNKVEDSINYSKDLKEQILNSDTKKAIIDSKSDIKSLTSKLTQLQKESERLYSEYCAKLTSIDSTKTNETQKINGYKKKLSAEQYSRDQKKAVLRKMKREFEERRSLLLAQIELKRKQKEAVRDSQMWKQRLNIQFEGDSQIDPQDNQYQKLNNKNKEKVEDIDETLYVTKSPLHQSDLNTFKVVAPASHFLDNLPPPRYLDDDYGMTKINEEEENEEDDDDDDEARVVKFKLENINQNMDNLVGNEEAESEEKKSNEEEEENEYENEKEDLTEEEDGEVKHCTERNDDENDEDQENAEKDDEDDESEKNES